MVSNQSVTRVVGLHARFAIGAAALLAAGCSTVVERDAQPPPAAAVERPAPVAEVQNAVDAALARQASLPPVAMTEPAPPSPVLNPNAPQTYVVKRGDTLWGISSMFLRDPWLWPEIWHVNPAVANPHLIYPGDTLQLVQGSSGQPEIRLVPSDVVRVSPLVRSGALNGPIETIPYKAIAAFLGRPGLLAKEEVALAPKVAVVHDAHLVAALADNIYITGMKGHGPGRYAVVRVGDELKDPETGRVLGYMAAYAASVRVAQADDKVTKAVLVESAREAVAGDLLFAEDVQVPGSDIIPHAPPAGVTGQILAVVDGVTQIGQYDVVALNRGSNDGLAIGHVLAIDQKGEVVPDGSCKTFGRTNCRTKVKLPDERAGALLIFKTYENLSYGLVVEATVPVRVADQVRTP